MFWVIFKTIMCNFCRARSGIVKENLYLKLSLKTWNIRQFFFPEIFSDAGYLTLMLFKIKENIVGNVKVAFIENLS